MRHIANSDLSGLLAESAMGGSGVLLATLFLFAVLGGYGARRIRVPKVVGYLVAGVGLRIAWNQLTGTESAAQGVAASPETTAATLRPIKTLSLGLILFGIGGVFEKSHLRTVGNFVLRISTCEIATVVILVAGGCAGIAGLVGVFSDQPTLPWFACIMLGTLAIATAPAATVLVLREYEAKGPVSDAIETLTAVNNAACVIFFHAAFVVFSCFGLIGTGASTTAAILQLASVTIGSALIGLACGLILSVLFAKAEAAEFVPILLGTVIVLGEISRQLVDAGMTSFSLLLTCLCMGATFANSTVDPDRLDGALRPITAPLFATFFVLAGFELHLADLSHIGFIGSGYVILRIIGKWIGCRFGVRAGGRTSGLPDFIGLGLICQAGVAIGLVDFLTHSWGSASPEGFIPHPVATRLKTLIIGSVVVFELTGPLLLKWVAVRCGEVKAITLLTSHRTASRATVPAFRLVWDAALRTFGLHVVGKSRATGPIQVRHVMRANIKLLPVSAGLDDVLHFVERSRYNDFPVADDDGNFMGMIHFSELRKIIYDPWLRELVTAIDLIDQDCPLMHPGASLTDAVAAFRRADTGLLPVVESDESRRIIGIIEQRDVLRAVRQSPGE